MYPRPRRPGSVLLQNQGLDTEFRAICREKKKKKNYKGLVLSHVLYESSPHHYPLISSPDTRKFLIPKNCPSCSAGSTTTIPAPQSPAIMQCTMRTCTILSTSRTTIATRWRSQKVWCGWIRTGVTRIRDSFLGHLVTKLSQMSPKSMGS